MESMGRQEDKKVVVEGKPGVQGAQPSAHSSAARESREQSHWPTPLPRTPASTAIGPLQCCPADYSSAAQESSEHSHWPTPVLPRTPVSTAIGPLHYCPGAQRGTAIGPLHCCPLHDVAQQQFASLQVCTVSISLFRAPGVLVFGTVSTSLPLLWLVTFLPARVLLSLSHHTSEVKK